MRLKWMIAGLFVAAVALAGEDEAYFETTFRGVEIRGYWVRPADLELHWLDPKTRRPYLRFEKLEKALAARGRRLRLITNAGIFEPGRIPSGLHVQEGRELRPLNLKEGDGNFFLKPNGVFVVDANKRAAVLESAAYARAGIRPWLAVQSGPLLLQDGKVHPGFSRTSKHRRHRNGVGVHKDGRVLFACTATGQKTYVTLYEFATFFREQGCANALFLDGDLSAMIVNPVEPVRALNEYAAIFTVTEAAAEKSEAGE